MRLDGPASIPAELLAQLWNDPEARSRNANFARFRDDRVYRRAVKHIRALLALRRDLLRYCGRCDVSVRWLASGRMAQVTMRVPELRLRRYLYLSAQELELIRGDPAWSEAEVVSEDDAPIDRDRRS